MVWRGRARRRVSVGNNEGAGTYGQQWIHPPPSDYGPDKDSVAVITVQTPLHCVCMCVCTDVCGSGGRRHCSISSCVSRTSLLYEEHVCVCMCGGGGPGGSFCAAFPLLSSGQSVKNIYGKARFNNVMVPLSMQRLISALSPLVPIYKRKIFIFF